MDECPADCNSWYDGCNTCECKDGKLGACTKRFCAIYEQPKCIDRICPTDCTTWYDGCNTCQCDKDGQITSCTKRFCIQQGPSYCSRFKNKKVITKVQDTLPPVISATTINQVELTKDDIENINTDLFFNGDGEMDIIVDDANFENIVAFNARILGLEHANQTEGYLSLDYLDDESSPKFDSTEFKIVEELAKRPGMIKERALLMDVAYREDTDIEDRTIDSHVKRIRKKFKKVDNNFSAIETRYGSGYRWNTN